MPRDRSLDEFGPSVTEEQQSGEDVDGSRQDETADAEPTVTTYQWSPAGGECAACGASVERRWRDRSGFVCAACKEW
ncbi:DUF7573 domain-containing protein [Haloarchaeobius sp. DT45]|uniref:DUF7573 domain-containing protein n=1 Tax=Haloarchaeobius sp. DT45 TaxID=3446116 RepID=UPI003F6A560B